MDVILFLYVYLGQAIYFIAQPNAPLLNSLRVDLGYMGLWVNVRIRVRGFEYLRFSMACIHY